MYIMCACSNEHMHVHVEVYFLTLSMKMLVRLFDVWIILALLLLNISFRLFIY